MKIQVHIDKYSYTNKAKVFTLHTTLLPRFPKSNCNHKSSGRDSDKYNETLGLGGVRGFGEGKLNKNPPNSLHELKFCPDAIAFTGTVKQ